MHYNIIKTAAGARTRLRLPMVWKTDAVAAEELPEAVFWVFIGGERVRVEKTPGSDDEYIFPELQAGQYAWDLVVDAQVVLHGVLKVRGSAVPPGGGEVCGTLLVDAPAMVLVLSPGPRGEVGPVGPQGLSAYEVALRHGYEGSEDDWAEELSGAQAAATESKRQAGLSASSAAAAANSATAAQQSATAAGNSASDSAQSATAAASSADTAGKQATAAGNSATAAASSAGAAGEQATAASNSATAAAASADTAGKQATAAADSAKAAASSAGAAGEQATAAGNSATAAAASATTAGEQATAAANSASAAASSAEGAADSATAAASTLAAAAKLADNNTFSGVNTFNGSLVANGPVTLPGAATVNGIAMLDLLGMQTALSSFLSTLAPVDAAVMYQALAGVDATSFAEWEAVNADWKTRDTLVFFAPQAKGRVPDATFSSSVKASVWVSSLLPPANGATSFLGRKILAYLTPSTIQSYTMQDIHNCNSATIILPNVKKLSYAFGCLGSSSTDAELHFCAPLLESIRLEAINNIPLYYSGLYRTFSFYAPKLTSSFYFSWKTPENRGQTCATLKTLVAGIGTPETTQTIFTLPPQGGVEEIAELEAFALAKNWTFSYRKLT